MPPPGWQPPPGWKPDPSWPEPPDGWQLWVEEPPPRSVPSKRTWGLIGAAVTLVGLLVIAFGPWFHPDFNAPTQIRSAEPRSEYDDKVNTMCQDVLDDLASGHPMDRVICGDVGFGKTEVALRAAATVAL